MKKKFKIIDMACASCALTIDMNVEDLEGVKLSNTNYAKSETEVEFDENKVKQSQIISAIMKAGYTAKDLNE